MLLTEKLKDAKPVLDPFPHIVLENALEQHDYDTLTSALPQLDKMLQGKPPGSNLRFNYSAIDIGRDSSNRNQLRSFAQAHLTQHFLDDILTVFSPQIIAYYPDFETRFARIPSLKAGHRGVDEASADRVLLDVQIGINTPVLIPGTTVRAPHVDCPRKLFIGLFYLRSPDDNSTGGDLEIYNALVAEPKMDETRTISRKDVECVKRIPYKANTLVLMLNTPNSYHGVTVRSMTRHPRLFVNLLGEMTEPLFQPHTQQEGWKKMSASRSSSLAPS